MANFLDVLSSRHAGNMSSVSLSRRSANGSDPDRIPPPSHRHAAPSAPWPWVDIGDVVDPEQLACSAPPIPELCLHDNCECWVGYPQSRFPNWTPKQVKKSRIWEAIHSYRRDLICTIYRCDVDNNGYFTDAGKLPADDTNDKDMWEKIMEDSRERPSDVRIRVLFVENMSGPVLQMLGARYNAEPFFFSSSLNWIPSRFQEEVQPGIGDHITITLTFIKSTREDDFPKHAFQQPGGSVKGTFLGTQNIDTQSPLLLYSNQEVLSLDLLSVHLIRHVNGSTMLSYHSTKNIPTTTAPFLHERMLLAGKSLYWQSMFQFSPDPTLVLLCFLWHALYGWNEALRSMYQHILSLEDRVVAKAGMPVAQELQKIRAHQLHFTSLLEDFLKTITFIQETPAPFMTTTNFEQAVLSESSRVLTRECKILTHEVERLKKMLYHHERLVILLLNSVSITDSNYMRHMTEIAVRDSAAMKQIAHLTMLFLPASLVASVFGMNVREVNPGSHGSIPYFLATALSLTALTSWIMIAFQSESTLTGETEVSFWGRLTWPLRLLWERVFKQGKKKNLDGFGDDPNNSDYNIAVQAEGANDIPFPWSSPRLPR